MAKGVPLPITLLWKVKQMYAEKDSYGRQRWSMREVAAYFGVSESTVLRAVTNTGRFANINATPLPATRTEAEMARDAAESLVRFQALVAAEAAKPAQKPAIDVFMKRAEEERARISGPPPSPLDGGAAPDESSGAGLAKLQELAGSGDALLDELTQTTKGDTDGNAESSK